MGIVGILLIVLGILLIAVAAWYFKDDITSYFTSSTSTYQTLPQTIRPLPIFIPKKTNQDNNDIASKQSSAKKDDENDDIVSKQSSAKKDDSNVAVMNPIKQVVLNVETYQQLANEPFKDLNNIITKSNQFIISCKDRFKYITPFDNSNCTPEILLQGLCYYHSKLRKSIRNRLLTLQQDSPLGDNEYHGDVGEYMSKVSSYEDQCTQFKVIITTYNTVRVYLPFYEWSSSKSLFQQKCDLLELLGKIDEASWVNWKADSILLFYIRNIKYNPGWKGRTSYIDEIMSQLKMDSWKKCHDQYQKDYEVRVNEMKKWSDDIKNIEGTVSSTNDIFPTLDNYCKLKASHDEKLDTRMIPVCKYILQQSNICNQTSLFQKVQQVANVGWTKDILELLRMRKWEDIIKEFQKHEEYCKRNGSTKTPTNFDELVTTMNSVEEKRTSTLQETRVKKLIEFATYLGIQKQGVSVDSLVEAILREMFNDKIPEDIAFNDRMRYIMINMSRYKVYIEYMKHFHESVKHLRVLFWLNEEATDQQRSILLNPITNFKDMDTYTQYFQQLLSVPNATLTQDNIVNAIKFRASSVLSKITNTLQGIENMASDNIDMQKLIQVKKQLTIHYTKDTHFSELLTDWISPLGRVRIIKLNYETESRQRNNDQNTRQGFSNLFKQYEAFFYTKEQKATSTGGFLSYLFGTGKEDSKHIPDNLFSLTESVSHWISMLDFKLTKGWKSIAEQTSPSEAESIINQQLVTAINNYITQIPTNQGPYSWDFLVKQIRGMKEKIGGFFNEKDVIKIRETQIKRARELKIEGTLHEPSWTYFGKISRWNEMPTTQHCTDEGSCTCMYHIILMKERITKQEKIISDDLIKTFQTILSHIKQQLTTWTQSANDLQKYRVFDVPEEVEQIPKVITSIIQIALPKFSLLDANISSDLSNEYNRRIEREISSYREVFTWFGVKTLPITFKEVCEFLSKHTQNYHSKLNLETLKDYYITWQKNKIKLVTTNYFIEFQYKLGSSRELEEQVKEITSYINVRSIEIQKCYMSLMKEAPSLVAETSTVSNDDDFCQVISQASKKLCTIGLCSISFDKVSGDSIQLCNSFMNYLQQSVTSYIEEHKNWIKWCDKSLEASWKNVQQLLLEETICKEIYNKETSQAERIKQNWEPLKSFKVTSTLQFQELKTKCHQWQHIQEVCNLLRIELCDEGNLWKTLKTRINNLKALSDHFFRFIHQDLETADLQKVPNLITMKNYATYLTNYENSFQSRGFTKERMEINIKVLQYIEQIKKDFNHFDDQFSTASSSFFSSTASSSFFSSKSGPMVDLGRFITRFAIHELIDDQNETNADKRKLEYNEPNLLQFSSLLTLTIRTNIDPKSSDVPSSISQWPNWYNELIKRTKLALITFLNYNPQSLSPTVPAPSNESFTTLWKLAQARITSWCRLQNIKTWDISSIIT